MSKEIFQRLQTGLQSVGLYHGAVDGDWGPQSQGAFDSALAAVRQTQSGARAAQGPTLAWGAKVSQTFRDRIVWIAVDLGMPTDGASWLMACMAWESAESFRPDIRNAAGSGATGLIQFMPATAQDLGTTVEALARLSPEDQLNWVHKYFRPYRGKLQTLADTYMAILWPAAIGQPESAALWTAANRPTTYRQNAGLDINKDATITKAEAAAKVREKLAKGLQPGYVVTLGVQV